MAVTAKAVSDALVRLNALEMDSEKAVSGMRWEQAKVVHELVTRHEQTQRAVALKWVNLATGRPYSQSHVRDVLQAWDLYGGKEVGDRPLFAIAMREASTGTAATERPAQSISKRIETKLTQAMRDVEDARSMLEELADNDLLAATVAKDMAADLEESADMLGIEATRMEAAAREG